MKKLVIVLLLFITASSLSAQFNWSVWSSFNTSFMQYRTPLGERAERMILIGDEWVGNDIMENVNTFGSFTGNNYGFTRGEYYYFDTTMDFFKYGGGIWTEQNTLGFYFGYQGEYVSFGTTTNLNRLVRTNHADANLGTGKDNWDSGAGEQSFVRGDGRSPNLAALLRYSIGWEVKGTFGNFTTFVGTSGNTGVVVPLNSVSSMLGWGINQDGNFGLAVPTSSMDIFWTQTNDLVTSGVPGLENNWRPYFMLGYRFENKMPFPLTVQLVADPGNNSGVRTELGTSYSRGRGAVRVSGQDVLGRINFDVIYKLSGGDPNILDNYNKDEYQHGTSQPSGDGFYHHHFGLYANIMRIANFNFAMGYSAYVQIRESDINRDTGVIISRESPFFHGIDFQVQFVGSNNLTISSANNISFTKTDYSSPTKRIWGVYNFPLQDYNSQEWFALNHTLSLNWNVFGNFNLTGQIGYRYGIFTTNVETRDLSAVLERSREQFGGGITAAYRFSNIGIEAGVMFRRLYDTFTNTIEPEPGFARHIKAQYRSAEGGRLDFAIPVKVFILY